MAAPRDVEDTTSSATGAVSAVCCAVSAVLSLLSVVMSLLSLLSVVLSLDSLLSAVLSLLSAVMSQVSACRLCSLLSAVLSLLCCLCCLPCCLWISELSEYTVYSGSQNYAHARNSKGEERTPARAARKPGATWKLWSLTERLCMKSTWPRWFRGQFYGGRRFSRALSDCGSLSVDA